MGKFIDLTGQRFAELTVEKLADIKLKNRPAWQCLCDCGQRKIVRGDSLKNGEVKCCGLHKTKFYSQSVSARSKIQNRKYPKETDSHSRLYTLWRAMKWRCLDTSHEAYYRYGGAGIVIDPDWMQYEGFRQWAVASGYRENLTIDRIDNKLGYNPSNCRWATPKEQANNRVRPTITIKAFNEEKTLLEWTNDVRCKPSLGTLRKRLYAGHSPEFALTATESQARSARYNKV